MTSSTPHSYSSSAPPLALVPLHSISTSRPQVSSISSRHHSTFGHLNIVSGVKRRNAFQYQAPVSVLFSIRGNSSTAINAANRIISSTASVSTTNDAVAVSISAVLLSMLPLISTIIVSHRMKLKLHSRIFVSAFRNFLQLSTLSVILRPIFTLQNPTLILSYMLFMTILAAWESSRRTKYHIQGQFKTVLFSLLTNIILTTSYAFNIVIKPKPIYNPQVLIPVTGMILGMCINGLSLSLNSLTSAIMEKQREIELYLSFGASPREALSKIVKDSIQAGMTPVLNNMSVMGLITIPGMMTGQMLGGASATDAARWQMVIMYLIGSCIFGTVLMENIWIARYSISTHGIRKELFFGQQKTSMKQAVAQLRQCFLNMYSRFNANLTSIKSYDCDNNDDDDAINTNVKTKSLIINVNIKSFEGNQNKNCILFNVDNVSVAIPSSSNNRNINNKGKVLFENLSFKVKEGEIAFINGPSGSGKSSLLRVLAKLSQSNHGHIDLLGVSTKDKNSVRVTGLNDDHHSETWRKHVRYLTQYKVDIPGTPMDSIDKFISFQSWKKECNSNHYTLKQKIKEDTIRLIQKWGLSETNLHQEWMTLSGGESQRIILAIALASKPNVILLDESTSALDQATKILVETTLVEEIRKQKMIAIWISHDSEREHLFATDEYYEGATVN